MKGEKTGGREKGTPNKLGANAKENAIEVFNLLQSDDTTSLLGWAKNNPTDFYTKIYTKLIPTAVDLDAKLEVNKPIIIDWMQNNPCNPTE
jgi:hypothetical protein